MLAPLEPSLVPYNPGNEVPMSQQGIYSGPSLRFKCIYLQTRQNRTCTTSPFPTATPVQNGCSVPLDTCLPPNKIPGGGEESFHLKILLRLQGPAPAQEAACRPQIPAPRVRSAGASGTTPALLTTWALLPGSLRSLKAGAASLFSDQRGT